MNDLNLDSHTIISGDLLHCIDNPWQSTREKCLSYHKNSGLVLNKNGQIIDLDDVAALKKNHPQAQWIDYSGKLIVPGFIDAHLHFPQLDIIGCFGESLLGWLKKYTFPYEEQFKNTKLAQETATRLIKLLMQNGTTCAAIYGSSFYEATDILFQVIAQSGYRAIAGKLCMDQNAPHGLLEEVAKAVTYSEALIKKWHGYDQRIYYALTPRFAPTCSKNLLTELSFLKNKYQDIYIQTHHSETRDEIAWVKSLFTNTIDYLDVYEQSKLTHSQLLLGHCLYPTNREIQKMKEHDIAVVHCPTSNTFLGSGLFPLETFIEHDIRLALGTDIGAGTSLSMWSTMLEAYKIQKLRGVMTLYPEDLFYLATLGGAQALNLDHMIGNFSVGKFADIQILDLNRNPLIKRRQENAATLSELLFSLIVLGDDRLTDSIYIAGRPCWSSHHKS